ncbi:hypothetical protein FOMPIDRAFT_160023, partial [Fomitopsis schrenkii]
VVLREYPQRLATNPSGRLGFWRDSEECCYRHGGCSAWTVQTWSAYTVRAGHEHCAVS